MAGYFKLKCYWSCSFSVDLTACFVAVNVRYRANIENQCNKEKFSANFWWENAKGEPVVDTKWTASSVPQ